MREGGMSGEFSVYHFGADQKSECVKRNVDAKEAFVAAVGYMQRPAAKLGIIQRVIITDGGDCVNFEWQFGKGIVFPPMGAGP